ncbi:protein phosphatase 2C domain-containing protein [Streptomyces brasiliensis]|uniref:PPM-type phosphatase domain-containing protein n=1 Tax=Streptomyces brasiliensis TaxID=1954 RepID=A0A917NX70_9ACTN|nr:protein phosphatase 2C domain-containing protein [Streptomyces brasiliensis]GGJ33974.1 hypothetical protein GCM10010121_051430 [Streptomyces brasiliensis]
MSQQGGRPTRREDDWWGELYDDSTEDTGPTSAADSLDDRFASAANTVTEGPAAVEDAEPAGEWGDAETVPRGDPAPGTAVPTQRAAPAPDDGLPKQRSSWEPPLAKPATPEAPATLPSVPASRMPPDLFRPPATERDSAPPARNAVSQELASPPARQGPTPFAAPQEPTPPPVRQEPAPSVARSERDTALDLGTAEPPSPAAAEGDRITPASPPPPADRTPITPAPPPTVTVDHVGSGPPTYDAEPTALPLADPDELDDLVADTVLDGARYGACTLRAVSVRGDSARFRGEPRRDSLLTARFGTGEQALILVAVATGVRATPGAHRAAAEVCQWIGRAVGRSHLRLVEDIRGARRGDLKSGLHRLTDRSLGKLRASASEQGVDPDEYAATLRCLLLPADPECRTRVFFGVGEGGLFRLRDGEWQDIQPHATAADATGEPVVGFGSLPPETRDGDRLTMDLGIPTPPSPYEPAPQPRREPFRFRASVARPGDALLMCSGGLAEPLRGEPALCAYLARRWSGGTPPGLAAFLADTQVRVKGYADDRTVAAVWEA